MIVAASAVDRLSLAGRARVNAEFVTRPYSPASMRWRVEAMLIRAETILIRNEHDIGADSPVGDGDEIGVESSRPSRRGRIVVIFNPKGGVGKTTIAVNTSAVLQIRKSQRVLLLDCDTVTGHVLASMGMGQPPSLVNVWNADLMSGDSHSLADAAMEHSSGVSVLALAQSPLHTEVLEPKRVAAAITAARETYDWIIADMHPDYGPLNQAIFGLANLILVPVTPDIPTMRAAVQFREVAIDLSIRDRLAIVVNRYNSGISPGDVERVVGVAAMARVRSAGMLFVQAANTGRSAVEAYPKARVVNDIETLAERLISARDDPRRAEGGGGFTRQWRDLIGRLTQSSGGPREPARIR
jgi:pilus assembly protein CpaE